MEFRAQIEEHYNDAGGATDHVFGQFRSFGLRRTQKLRFETARQCWAQYGWVRCTTGASRVGGQGVFAVYENTSPDGEDREHWHRRWNLQKLHWTAYTTEEWDVITAHVHASDIPETTSRWHELGHGSFVGTHDRAVPPVPEILAIGADMSPAYGRWVKSGDREFQLTFYAAIWNKDGVISGFHRIQASIVLSESGDEFTAKTQADFSDANWKTIISNTGEVKATRLKTPDEK